MNDKLGQQESDEEYAGEKMQKFLDEEVRNVLCAIYMSTIPWPRHGQTVVQCAQRSFIVRDSPCRVSEKDPSL